jgi:hypothetical protein
VPEIQLDTAAGMLGNGVEGAGGSQAKQSQNAPISRKRADAAAPREMRNKGKFG